MPADPAQLQALDQHESNKKIGELPYFHGIASKDLCTAKQLVTRLEHAADVCGWTPKAKAQRFAATLKGPAYTWYEGLKRSHRLNPKDWPTLKKYFLQQYEKLVTSSTLTRSLKDIQMKSTETVAEYNDRCQAVFNEYYDQYVDKCCQINEVVHAGNVAANHELMKASMEVSAQFMMIYMQMTLYEAGLLEYIRLEVATKKYDSLMDLQLAAQNAEARHSTKKTTLHSLALGAGPEDDQEGEDQINEIVELEDYDTVATIFRSMGRKMPSNFRKKFKSQQQTRAKGNAALNLSRDQKKEMDCWHCGKKGHLISECRGKSSGKPKAPGAGPKNRKINEVEEQQGRLVNIDSLNF